MNSVRIPSRDDFLSAFGVEPTEWDGSGFSMYTLNSADGVNAVSVSFDELARSFSIGVKNQNIEYMRADYESLHYVEIFRREKVSKIIVKCSTGEWDIQIYINIDPEFSFRSSVLQK